MSISVYSDAKTPKLNLILFANDTFNTSKTNIKDMIDDNHIMNQYAHTHAWGMSTAIDLHDCKPDTIRDPDEIEDFVIQLCDLIDMKQFGEPMIVSFGDGERAGYSLVQLIETSCITAHFAEQDNNAYVDIFSCKAYPPEKAANFCKEFFGAKDMKITTTLRK